MQLAARSQKLAPGTIRVGNEIIIPPGITTFEAFRRWTHTDSFPRYGRIDWLAGVMWISDFEEQPADARTVIARAINATLDTLVRDEKLGRYYAREMRLVDPQRTNVAQPAGMFVTNDSIRERRLRKVRAVGELFEMEGCPDMVLEVSGREGRERYADTRAFYRRVGVRECWTMDVRHDSFDLTIYRRTARAFLPVRAKDGWLASPVFGRGFRLTTSVDALGVTEYTLEMNR